MNTVPKTMPLISVRIPTKDRPYLLIQRAINSVLYQTYPNLEVVVVGDDCDIRTERFLYDLYTDIPVKYYNLPPRSYEERKLMKDPEIRWFMGPVRATNEATNMCLGEWIAHLDDDDIWTPDHVERSYNYAVENNYDFVSSKLIRKRDGKYEEVSGENGIGGCQTWLYKTELAKRFPYNPECYKKTHNRVSDLDVAERIVASGARVGFLDVVGAYVLPRPGEITVGLKAYKK